MGLMLSHCRCRQRLPLDVAAVPRPDSREYDHDDTPIAVAMPNGSAHAAEAFAWMNRQITWQSLVADLEVLSWLADGDADHSTMHPEGPQDSPFG
jgi:hypothetical protein